MKIFIAGATGAIGSRIVPLFVQAGHDVVGTSRSAARARTVDAAGGRGIVLDGRDLTAVRDAVHDARPDVVIHQLTSLSTGLDYKHWDRGFAETNDLRTRTTDALISAAGEVGTERIIVQSYTGWTNEHAGSLVKTEEDPLEPNPSPASRRTLAAVAHAEQAAVAAGGIALRYGTFYGPGQAIGHGGQVVESIRKRRLPIVGDGAGVWSFLHVDDAATATLAATTRGERGIYNIVDDEPAAVSEWLPALAQAVGAKPPLRVPSWVARALIGEFGVAQMTTARGSSNRKAKTQLSWQPQYATWRDGFRTGLGARVGVAG